VKAKKRKMKRRKRKPGYAARIKRQALARKKRLKAGLHDYAGRVVQPIDKRVKRNRRLRRKSDPDKKVHLSGLDSPKLSKRELDFIRLESARINASRAKSGYQDVD
jgi:hypothetical protein